MKSHPSSKMGHAGSKTRSLGQILENLVYALEATFLVHNHETWSEYMS